MAAYHSDSSITFQMTQFLFDHYTDDKLNVNFHHPTDQVTALMSTLLQIHYNVVMLLLLL